ncbi:MAG: transaldolase, partial [Thermoplasmata archaeon]|nr:transaldolase [Thermoplasmata archaeon]
MKIFADTGMLDEIREAASWGILDGVTTNPSLIKKAVEGLKEAGKDISMKEYIEEILKTAGKGKPVSLEVVSTTEDEMVAEARKLFETFNRVAENVVVKIPVNPTTSDDSAHTYDGLRAIKKLSSQGIPINTTLIMNPTQALLAAKAGATYVSPFAGRIDDYLRTRARLTFEKGDYFDVMGL